MNKTILALAAVAVFAVRASAAATSDLQFARSLEVSSVPQSALAAHPQVATVVRDQTTTVPVDLNERTVKCSAADYQAPMLKVLVPDLAQLTVLNHRNTREGAPCIAAGRCFGGVGPEDLLKNGAGIDRVPVKVVLTKLAETDGDVCRVTLVEKVEATIRGVKFFHERRQAVADRAAADCR